MHPAYSVIVFTAASGAGYGLLFWLSLAALTGLLPAERWLGFSALALALVLISVGLLSSTWHLGHPERVHRAFSQWRSSWLSREGIAAVFTYLPVGLLGLIWLFNSGQNVIPWLAALAALGAIVTVYCTGMIYASLRTIRHWHLTLVPLFYLAAAASTGAVLFALLLALFGSAPSWIGWLVLLSLIAALLLKLSYWQRVDNNQGQYTVGMATGLGHLGKVRPLDPPHTMPNFVMREMGYRVARKHAIKLRRITLVCLFAIPLLSAVLALLSDWVALFYGLAALFAALGIVLERWLFFAEAEHVSMLFYGAQRA